MGMLMVEFLNTLQETLTGIWNGMSTCKLVHNLEEDFRLHILCNIWTKIIEFLL